MKKSFTQLLPLALIAFSLVSCGTSSEAPTSTSEIYDENDIEILDNSDDFTEGSTGGWFDEISAGRFLADHSDYECTFTPSSVVKTYTVTSSNPEFLTVEHTTGNKIVLHALKPGDSYVEVTTTDDMLVLRQTVRVRKGYEASEISKVIFNNDLYYNREEFFAFTGAYRINAINTGEHPQLVVAGRDELDSHVNCVCTLTYQDYYAPFDAYGYFVEITERLDEKQDTEICYMYITRTADTIYVYYDPGENDAFLLTWVWPQKYDSIRAF